MTFVKKGVMKMKNPKGLLARPSRWLVKSVLAVFAWGMVVPFAAAPAQAQFVTPTAGDRYTSPREAPCISYGVGPSTGTAESGIVGSGAAGITTTVTGWVNWVSVSTGPADSYLVLRDTGTTGSGLVELTGRVYYTTATANVTAGVPGGMVRYDPPVEFRKGLTVQVTGCATGCYATVCYRKAKQQWP